MNWFSKLLASKISITIVTPGSAGVTHSTTPRVVEETVIKRKRLSNFRFVSDKEIDHNGEETIWYATQEFDGKSWSLCANSLSRDKAKAMDLHLKIIQQGGIESVKTRTVLWEGLSKDETKTWIDLQK